MKADCAPNQERNNGSKTEREKSASRRPSEGGELDEAERQETFQRWNAFTSRIKQPIQQAVTNVALMAVRWPITTILGSIILAISLFAIGLGSNFEINNTGGDLWNPIGCMTVAHKAWIYGDEAGFPDAARSLQVLIHANGDNILNVASYRKVFQVLDTIRETPGYDTLCAVDSQTKHGECPIHSSTGFWENHSSVLFEQEIQTNEDLVRVLSGFQLANSEPFYRDAAFGNPMPDLPDLYKIVTGPNMTTSEDWEVEDTSSFLLDSVTAYYIRVDLPDMGEESLRFESEALNRLFDVEDSWNAQDPINTLVLEQNAYRSYSDEVLRSIERDIPLMVTAFVVMGCFCAFVLSKRHPVRSQSILGAGAVATIFLSVMAGYGIMFIAGVPFTTLTQAFPYIMLGIGLDDTFIITVAFSRADPSWSMERRIEHVMQDIGLSISVSTLTTFMAFSLGAFSDMPGLKWFAGYASLTVAIDFWYQVTFFVAILTLDDRRQKVNRRDCCPCCTVKMSSRVPDHVRIERHEQASGRIGDGRGQLEGDEDVDSVRSCGSRFMEAYVDLLMRPCSKIAVLLGFAAMAGAGGVLASRQTQEFDWKKLVPEDSYFNEFFAAVDGYMSATTFMLSACYFRGSDVSVEESQAAMISFVDDMVALDFVSEQPRNFWLKDFLVFQEEYASNLENVMFYDQLDVFLSLEPYNLIYKGDVIRDENKVVTASRTMLVMDGLDLYDAGDRVDALKTIQQVGRDQPINYGVNADSWQMFAYGEVHQAWETYAALPGEVTLSVCFGLIAVFVIALIFLPHPFGALIVTPVVGIVYVELMALLYLADIYINSISAVGLTMSIGIVVDYNMHMILSYFEETTGKTREERVRKVLLTMGKSIMLGGITTFLGVIPLSISSSEIFRTFFVTFLGIVIFGASHGLVFLPVVLSCIGPHKLPQVVEASEVEASMEEDNGTAKHTR